MSAIVLNQLLGPPALKYALRAAREDGCEDGPASDEMKSLAQSARDGSSRLGSPSVEGSPRLVRRAGVAGRGVPSYSGDEGSCEISLEQPTCFGGRP